MHNHDTYPTGIMPEQLIWMHGCGTADAVGRYVEANTPGLGRIMGRITKCNQRTCWIAFNRAGQTHVINRRWVRDCVKFVEVIE